MNNINPMPMFAAGSSPSPDHTSDNTPLNAQVLPFRTPVHSHYVSEPFGRLSLVGSMLTASVVLPRVLLCTSRNSLAAELYLKNPEACG